MADGRAAPKLLHDAGSARLVELVAYAATTDWAEFLAIRQDVCLRVLGPVEEAGTRLAVPVRLELEAPAPGLDDERARAAAEQARRWSDPGHGQPEMASLLGALAASGHNAGEVVECLSRV